MTALGGIVEGGVRTKCRALPVIATALLLAACNSQSTAQDTLDPNAISISPAMATTPAATTPAKDTAALAGARIQFAPIVGTSVEAANSLSARLTSRARERGIQTVGSGDKSTTQMLKGYFTPLIEGRDATVIYVWDVYDPAGNRVHRISGQQKSKSAGGDAWAAVPPATMQAIADATVDQLATWLAVQNGG